MMRFFGFNLVNELILKEGLGLVNFFTDHDYIKKYNRMVKTESAAKVIILML